MSVEAEPDHDHEAQGQDIERRLIGAHPRRPEQDRQEGKADRDDAALENALEP